jgi:hypothetical protein
VDHTVDIADELAAELEGLTEAQREEAVDALRLRRRAADLALELGLDAGDVYHQLRQFQRTPLQRLRRGLAHGRRRRIPE